MNLAALARALAFVHVAPVLSEAAVPERARMALGLLLGLVLAPAVGGGGGSFATFAREAAWGALLGLVLSMAWSTVSALLPQLASQSGLDDGEEGAEPPSARLALAVGLMCFLGLNGDHALIALLAAPRALPAHGAGLAELAVAAGSALFAMAAEGLIPFLAVLAAARIAAALVSRAASVDLTPFHAPVLAVAAFLLVGAFVRAAPLLYEDALREGASLAAPHGSGGPR